MEIIQTNSIRCFEDVFCSQLCWIVKVLFLVHFVIRLTLFDHSDNSATLEDYRPCHNALKSMDNFGLSSNTVEHRYHLSSSSITDSNYYLSSGPGSDPRDVRRPNDLSSRLQPSVSQNTYSSSSMATGNGNESTQSEFQFSQREEGYDLEFVHPRDEKYDCPICLLVLREPQQTPCGHRFCKYCIQKWLRESESEPRCPVDNAPLSETQLFPDNFAKREILALLVKCPNNKEGCEVHIVLKQLQSHLQSCEYSCVPCPNQCSHILLAKDLSHHLKEVCLKRTVQCSTCKIDFTADNLQKHEKDCPLANVSCSFCGLDLIREQLQRHLDHDCPKAVVNCQYREFGCAVQVERNEMGKHLQTSIQEHMQQMRRALLMIFQVLNLSHRNLPSTENVSDDRQATEASTNELSSIASLLSHLNLGLSERTLTGAEGNIPGGNQIRSSNENSSAAVATEQGSQNLNVARRDDDRTTSNTTQEASKLSYTSRENSGSGLECIQGTPSLSEFEINSLMNRNAAQDESLARHEHLLDELKLKNDYLERKNLEFRNKLKCSENIVNDLEGRTCNGTYVWKIKMYSKFRRDAEQGDTTAIHSPPFYSSFYGYKLCIRVNLNGVDSARGTHLSVFVHFMQGDYDDILEWPFHGRIVLTVVDQNPLCDMRHHVVETLIAKPNLAAFQRPLTPRNHKGFGYMEFLPLGILDNSTYIKNDTLIIKAFVTSSGGL